MPQQMMQQSVSQGLPPQQQRLLSGRAPRHRTLACHARRTVSGSSDTSTNKGSPVKRPESSSKARSSKTTGAVAKPPAAAPQHNSSRGTQGMQRQPNKRSALEEFMRTTPGAHSWTHCCFVTWQHVNTQQKAVSRGARAAEHSVAMRSASCSRGQTLAAVRINACAHRKQTAASDALLSPLCSTLQSNYTTVHLEIV
jgi:hypothetical protein